MSSRMEFDFEYAQPQRQREYQQTEEDPLRILVLGDFSGRGQRGALEIGDALAERPLLPIDVDNLESRLFGFNPRIEVPVGAAAEGLMTVPIAELEDFHPDRLYEKLDLFQQLRDLRRRLSDPATFEAAARELQAGQDAEPPAGATGEESGPSVPPASPDAPAAAEDSGSMFERLLGKAPSDEPEVRIGGRQVDISQLLQSIVGPHIVPQADPRQEPLIASVDQAVSAQMRRLLHHPTFQSLEAAWRGLWWLVSNVETGDEIKIAMLDVSKQELAADLASPSLEQTGLYRSLVTRGRGTPGGQAWSVVAGLYHFGPGADDLALLATLGRVAAQAGGAFVAAAHPRLLGCPNLAASPDPNGWQSEASDAQRWQAVRRGPTARNIGLALPRFLLRLPYGPATEEIESFAFEEIPQPPEQDALLWGNPALVLAQLLASAFMENGWRMSAGDVLDVADLPAFIYEQEGSRHLQACAEVYLSERAGEAILTRGIMPLLSYQQRNAARLMRFQSIADPPAGLAGPWG